MTLHSWPFLGRTQPFEVVRAEGAYLYREDGSAILDAGGGAVVVNIGHGRREVSQAIFDANCSYVVPTWMTPERKALVNELKNHWLPEHLSRIHRPRADQKPMRPR